MRINGLKSVGDVFHKFVTGMSDAPQLSTFRQWVGIGTRFSFLAGAGHLVDNKVTGNQ
jgi:hypothetical protein